MTVWDLIERASTLGIRVVQIADNLPLHVLPEKEIRRLRERSQELGIDIEVGTRGVATPHLQRYLDLARQLASPIVRVVVDSAGHQPGERELVSLLQALIPEFEEAGICLAIENHDRFPARTLARIVERVGSANTGICLDTVNSFGALEGPEIVLEALGPWVVNLHLKDFTIERAGHNMGFTVEGRPAGKGRLNIPWLLDRLRGLGRNPNAILELWTAPEAVTEATIAKEAAWAAESIDYLRTLIPD
jgi:sugar phosphate isomerase/epimerase